MSDSTISQRLINGHLNVLREALSDDPVIQKHNHAIKNAWDVQAIVANTIDLHDSIVSVRNKTLFSIFDLRDMTDNLISWLDEGRRALQFARSSKVDGYAIDRVDELEEKVYAVANSHDVLRRDYACAANVIAGKKVKLKDWLNGLRSHPVGRGD